MSGLTLTTHDGRYVGLVFAADIGIAADGGWLCIQAAPLAVEQLLGRDAPPPVACPTCGARAGEACAILRRTRPSSTAPSW